MSENIDAFVDAFVNLLNTFFHVQTAKKLSELEGNLETTVKKTTKKVTTLKAQFHEHKKRWESVSYIA